MSGAKRRRRTVLVSGYTTIGHTKTVFPSQRPNKGQGPADAVLRRRMLSRAQDLYLIDSQELTYQRRASLRQRQKRVIRSPHAHPGRPTAKGDFQGGQTAKARLESPCAVTPKRDMAAGKPTDQGLTIGDGAGMLHRLNAVEQEEKGGLRRIRGVGISAARCR